MECCNWPTLIICFFYCSMFFLLCFGFLIYKVFNKQKSSIYSQDVVGEAYVEYFRSSSNLCTRKRWKVQLQTLGKLLYVTIEFSSSAFTLFPPPALKFIIYYINIIFYVFFLFHSKKRPKPPNSITLFFNENLSKTIWNFANTYLQLNVQ